MAEGLPAVRGGLADRYFTRRYDALLQIDTGSNASLSLPQRWVERHPQVLTADLGAVRESRGVGGATSTTHAKLAGLHLFGRTLQQREVSLESIGFGRQASMDPVIGRLGNGVLARYRITFDWRSSRVWVSEPATP